MIKPNIVENSKALATLQLAVQNQAAHIAESLRSVQVQTDEVGLITFVRAKAGPNRIDFVIVTDADCQLEFHYDVIMDQFFIDEDRLFLDFKGTTILLEKVETFIRKIIMTSGG